MILERTLHMLQTHSDTQARAAELGRLGFMQWLGGLDGRAGFAQQASAALEAAADFRETDPAVDVFCRLISEACEMPPKPLDLALPQQRRRGGARARRRKI